MAMIRSYNQPTVEARPAPNATVPGNAPIGAFGNAMQAEGDAQAAKTASAYLERASDTTASMALSMMRDANEARVQELANGFISGQQFTLYTDHDAFYRKKGEDAINGAQAATDKLIQLRKETVGMAANDYQRKRLDEMLNSQMLDATNGISRHVATQAAEWEKNVAAGRQQLLLNQTSLQWNDFDAIEKNAAAAESVAKEQARQQGLSGTDAEKAMVAAARSNHFATAITQQIQNDQKRSALALYNKVKGQLDEKDNIKLASAVKSIATEVEGEDWINRQMPNAPRQEARRFFEAKGYSPEASSVLAGNFQWESGNNPGAVNPRDGRDGSDSVGIGQWNADRAKALRKFAADNNLDPKERKTQLEFAAHELETTERDTGQKLKSAKTLEEANTAAVGFFRPAGWTAKTPEAAHGYKGRLDNARAAFTTDGVGFDKANTQGLVLAAYNDPSLSPAVKASIATRLNRESSALEATRTAQIKGLDDTLEATTQAMIASPSTYKKGTIAAIADGFDAAGEKSKAVNARLVAGMEDTLLSFAQAPKSAQEETMRTVAAALLPGKGKALADSLNTANTKDKADAAKTAGEDYAALKTAASNNVRMDTMEGKARGIVDGFVKAGNFVQAREAADFFDAQVKAQAAGQAPPAQLAAAIGDMRTRIEGGEQTNTAIRQLDAMQDTQRKQDAAFRDDPYTAGTNLYTDVGKAVPISWNANPETIWQTLQIKATQASKISANRGGAPVLMFSNPEVEQLRNAFDTAPPERQKALAQALAYASPEQLPLIATALSGKQGGDEIGQSYAAAFGLLSSRNPAEAAVADEVLRGAAIRKAKGADGKTATPNAQAWRTELDSALGTSLVRLAPDDKAMIESGIASAYTARMASAGKSSESLDTSVLRGVVTSMLGTAVTKTGSSQAFYPPERGMDTYQVDEALKQLKDTDLPGLRTMEGDPITADLIYRRGHLYNVGTGRYVVRVPDPRTGDLGDVADPATGQAWILDMRPLVDRTREMGVRPANAPDYVTGVPKLGGRKE